MARHELLDNVTHKDLRINCRYSPGCGFDQNVARVFPSELGALQAEYPLFLIRNADSGQYDLVALLGFEAEENLYLSEDQWLARAMPLTIERQPFLIGFDQSASSPSATPVIHIDMEHPAVSQGQGTPVFLPHGGEGPLLERMNQVLGMIHQGHEASEQLSRTLSGLDLVESLNLEVQFSNGHAHALTGLYTINEERLNSLTADSLSALHEKGYLQHIYMLLASMPQLGVLIERKNTRLSQGQG